MKRVGLSLAASSSRPHFMLGRNTQLSNLGLVPITVAAGAFSTALLLTFVLLPKLAHAAANPADAVPILYYDFENNTTRTTFENLVEQSVNSGSGAITRAGNTTTISSVAGAGTFNGGAASGQSATGSSWDSSTTDPGSAATNYYQFVVNTSGFSQLSITVDNQASGTGPARIGVLYSTDGSTFSATTTTLTGNAAFTASTFDLTAITAVDNQSSVTIRLYAFAGSAGDRTGRSLFGSGGTFRIDNLTVRAATVTASKTLLDYPSIGLSIKSGTAFTPAYSDFTVNGSGITVALASAIQMSGSLTISNGTLSCGTNIVSGAGSFVLSPGATLGIGNANGITAAPTATGNIQTTTRSFDTAANYIYDGSVAQVTGSGMPPTVNNLTVNNSSGVTLSGATTITTALTIGSITSNSIFDDGGFQITSTSALNLSNGSAFRLGSAGTGTSFPAFATRNIAVVTTVEYASNQPQTIAAINYSNLTSSGSGARALTSSGTIGIGEAFTPGTNTYTITGSTIDFQKATTQTIPAFNYNNLSNSGNGPRTYPNGGTVKIAGTFSYGNGGPHTVTGSTIELNGTSSQSLPNQGFTFNNLTINNAAGVTAGTTGSPVSVGGTLSLANGALTNGMGNNLTIASGATINRAGGSIAAAPIFSASVNVIYSGSSPVTTGPEIPSSTTVLNNLTIGNSGGVTLGANAQCNGVLTLTNDLTVPSGLALTQSGTSAGAGDVIGVVHRNDLSGTTRAFGNPNVQITITAGTITSADVNLAKDVAPGAFPNAILRTYSIEPGAGALVAATLRLHYLDAELNDNTEGSLTLWRATGSPSATWQNQLFTSRDTTDNWVELTGVTGFRCGHFRRQCWRRRRYG
jgi:hypothetical protein